MNTCGDRGFANGNDSTVCFLDCIVSYRLLTTAIFSLVRLVDGLKHSLAQMLTRLSEGRHISPTTPEPHDQPAP